MPGSRPSGSPLGASSSATVAEQNARRQQHQDSNTHQQHPPALTHDNVLPVPTSAPRSSFDLNNNQYNTTSSTPTLPRVNPNRNHNHNVRYTQLEIDLEAQFSEFVRSTRRNASSDHPVIESYVDNEDYHSLLAAVSNIHMSRAGTHTTSQVDRGQQAIAATRGVLRSPYPSREGHVRLDDGMSGMDEDSEDGYMDHSDSTIEDLYDLQHIMVHNQREFEDQMRRARADYDRHQNTGMDAMDDTQDVASRATESSLELPSSVSSSTATTVEAHRNSAEHYTSSTVQLRPSISSSYFSPTTESTIVLSSPPPGRALSIPSRNPTTTAVGTNTATERLGNGPYRPFVTGTEISILQQQQQHQRPVWHHNSMSTNALDLTSEQLSNQGGRVLEGESAAGHWSTYGSVIQANRSFEQHRFQYYRQQQQQQQTQASYHHRQSMEDISFDGSTAFHHGAAGLSPRSRPMPSQSYAHPYWSQYYTPHPRPFSVSGGSLMRSNLPIPSRYLGSQPFSSHHTSTLSYSPSHLARPQNIMTGQGYNPEHHGPASSMEHEPSGVPRRHTFNGPAQSYSATVERAEAGGWDHPSHSSVSDQASWQDGAPDFRGRHHIGLKEVVRMACRFCESIICERGMKAQLLADQSVALLSTDDAPESVQLVGTDYRPTNCYCKIRDTACLVCGNAIGYHITQPCEKCLNAENNGHLWLFHPEYIMSCPRLDPGFSRPLRWRELPEPDQDYEALSLGKVPQGGPGGRLVIGGMVRRGYESVCR
ncbi:hypothetical protein KVV02_001047 [Mortierella alpina]|uniref:Uncharacterized protein n=1 Tax=Mortierella alpina TaxID=64518 RepID=A0A9P8A569_MORAP|nr:hypothetical protein KVV02_001047 [Mortierella alpina]